MSKKIAGAPKGRGRAPVETKALVSLPYLHTDADAERIRALLTPTGESDDRPAV